MRARECIGSDRCRHYSTKHASGTKLVLRLTFESHTHTTAKCCCSDKHVRSKSSSILTRRGRDMLKPMRGPSKLAAHKNTSKVLLLRCLPSWAAVITDRRRPCCHHRSSSSESAPKILASRLVSSPSFSSSISPRDSSSSACLSGSTLLSLQTEPIIRITKNM